MRLTVFSGIGDAHETRLVPDGLSYRAACPDIVFDHAVIVSGGRISDPDDSVREGAFIRVLPEAPAVVAAVAIIGAAVVVGVGAGVVMYQMKKARQAQTPEVQADRQRSITNNDGVTNLPFQKGATNALATGKSQPYVMGRHGFTPYLLTGKWYELSGPGGRDQYVTQAFECGFGPLIFEELRADEVMLRQFSDGEPQDGNGTLIDSDFSRGGSYEIAQDGTPFSSLTQVNTRIASATSSQTIPFRSEINSGAATELIVTLDPYARDVTLAISFPMGLYATNREDGSHHATTARIGAYFSVDGGNSWIVMPFTLSAPTGNQLIYTDRQTVTVAPNFTLWTGDGPIPSWARKGYDTYWKGRTVYTKSTLDKYVAKGYEVLDIDFFEDTIGTLFGTAAHLVVYTLGKPVSADEMNGSLSSDISACSTDEVRYEASRRFSWAEVSGNHSAGNRSIYVKLVNESTKDSYITNTACLLYYESHCYDPEKSEAAGAFVDCPILEPKEMALSAMLAVRIKANAANEDKLRKINVVVRSLARIWDGESWSPEKTTTSNPAAILLEILTSDIHPMSRFVDSELDLNAFGGLYEFCGENGITFNAVQTAKATKKALLETVCGVCRASLYWNVSGLLSVAWDCWQSGPIAVLDADSVIDVKVKKEYARRVDAMRITYTEADSWEQKTVLVKRHSALVLDADSVIQELTVTGIEYLPEVQKYARYMMACQNLRPKIVTVTLGREGMFFTPWARIRLTDDALGDDPQELIITAVRGNGDGCWELDCADYNDGIYDSGDIADYESNVREWADPADSLPVPYVRQGELEDQLSKLNTTGSAVASYPDEPTVTAKASMDGLSLYMTSGGDGLKNVPKTVTWVITRPDGSRSVVEGDASAGYAFNRELDGYPEADDLKKYRVMGKLTNIYSRTASSKDVSVDVSGYGTWIPLVAELTAQRITGRTATLSFGQRPGRFLYGETRYKIEIRRHGERPWFRPDLTRDPYGSEDAYKAEPSTDDVTEGLNTTHSFTQTLPLEGQNDVIQYESWYYTSPDRKDAYGNLIQQSPRTRTLSLVSRKHIPEETFVLGDTDGRPFGLAAGSLVEVYGEVAGKGDSTETVCVVRFQNELYELEAVADVDGVPYAVRDGMVDVRGSLLPAQVFASTAVIGGKECPVSGTVWINGTAYDAAEVCDGSGIFTATRHSHFFVEDGANPRDTLYEYRATAYVIDPATGRTVHRADGLSVFVTALATSAADVVNSAITHNKIAEGAVQVENLAAGCITADKMAVRDLFAICGVFGRIQDNEIADVANNFWNLETGQFLISNGVKDSDGFLTLPDSEYFAYTPKGYVQPDGSVAEAGSFWFKIANFIVSSVSSIIKGVFRVQKTNSTKEAKPFLEANPTSSDDGQTGVPAETLRVNGTLDAKSIGLDLINAIYPVGSIYLTMAEIEPADLFPGTEWEKVEGKFLLGASEDYGVGSTGGEAEHTLTEQEMPSHTHGMTAAGGHSHTGHAYAGIRYMVAGCETANNGVIPLSHITPVSDNRTSTDGTHTHPLATTGGGQAHNNMPPYIAVHMWQRTK